MKKILLQGFVLMMASTYVFAQSGEIVDPAAGINQNQEKLRLKTNAVTQEKTDQFEIQGLGSTVFTASNVADGTPVSFTHALQINLSLVPVTKPNNPAIQLIFYSSPGNIYQAAFNVNGTVNIFYPVAFYESIKEKLDQYILAKKKILVKVVQKPGGYREGSLIFN